MNGIQSYWFAMTIAVAVFAVVIIGTLLYILYCQNVKKVDGRTYKVLPQASAYSSLDITGLNGSKGILQHEEFNDESQEET